MPMITYIVAAIVALLLLLLGQYSGAATVVLLSMIYVKVGEIVDLLRARNQTTSREVGRGGVSTETVKVRQ